MSKIALYEFNSKSVRVIFLKGNPWFVAKDVLAAMESTTKVTDLEALISEDLGDEFVSKESVTDSIGRKQKMLCLSETALRLVLTRSRSANAKEIAQQLNLDSVLVPRVEIKTISIIANAFQHLSPVQQFFVSGYRIDLYFPEHRLAVECDETHHTNKTIQDTERQDVITKILGCQWIRYSPSHPRFCVGKIINKIFLTLEKV